MSSSSSSARDPNRIRNALWGLFIGDALAMPVHWYYNPDNITKDFGPQGITQYEDAKHPHPESFMVGMKYQPDVDSATRLGRKFDIVHEHRRFYDTTFGNLEIAFADRGGSGNPLPALEERYHYHHGLKAGDNTLGAQLVRVLIRSIVQHERYDHQAFLNEFIEFMTTPGPGRRDPYCEMYLCRWFENYARGLPPHACAEQQREKWAVAAHGGMLRPLVLSLIADSPFQGIGLAVEHQNYTHRSETVISALSVTVPLLHQLTNKAPTSQAWHAAAALLRAPQISHSELVGRYKAAKGPFYIPPLEMWGLHTQLQSTPFDVDQEAKKEYKELALSTACYPEHGVPLSFVAAVKTDFDLRRGLLASANLGGDNVHRNGVLGLLLGAGSEEVPEDLKRGLVEHEQLNAEIEAFVTLLFSGKRVI